VEFIKRYIDIIAMHKMNIFHWHLTDDNGWRIEIKKYPGLTETSAWRVDREDQPWRERTPPEPGEKATYGGYYTQEEIKDVVRYAAERHVTVIPEVEMPGHTSEVFASYPDLSCRGEKLYVQPGSYWPNIDIFCAGKEETFEFLEDVLSEVAQLFPSEYIHIGGDEANKTRWKECPLCQERIEMEGLRSEEELQSYFIKRIERYLQSIGKKLIGWDEILEGGLAPEATVMSWRGFEGGIDAVGMGHDVIMCPTSHCYFDYYQDDPETQPVAIGGFTPLEKVYEFYPIPAGLSSDKAKHILGGQGNVWTEFIPVPEHAEYMALPRMTALAEVLWSPRGRIDWDDFKRRLNTQFERFDMMGVNYYEGR
jgi:hexosaminidase